jgi:NADPH-dependent ferric siderophore reductase
VETLARRDVERIVEARDEAWSLPALVDSVEEVDGRSVWEAFAEVRDDDHISTECYH